MDDSWNSLEIVKIIISALGPILGGIIAWQLSRFQSRISKNVKISEKLLEKRLEVYENVAPSLNDLLCFFTWVGNWKEFSPPEIIQKKRTLDRDFHLYSPLFSSALMGKYRELMQSCFLTHTGWGQDAKLRSEASRYETAYSERWEESWNASFSEEDNRKEIRRVYEELFSLFKVDLAVFQNQTG